MLLTFAQIATLCLTQPGRMPTEVGEPMVVTAGNDVGWQVVSIEEGMRAFAERGELRRDTAGVREHWAAVGSLYAEHGVTAFEPYVKWMLLEPEEGVFDPTFYDAELEVFQANGLSWVPFLIAGPAYATPPWFKESEESVFAVDLGSGDVSRDQSIWNPHLRPRVRAWLARFFEHYDAADMQAVLLGISGVFGESIYTAGGNAWTHIWDGAYPQHLGWWCGDVYAAEDFRRAMAEKYGSVEALNAAWGTELASLDEVAPFVPDAAHNRRARLDLVRWYMQAMTDYAEWWVATTRELAPEVPILLCTGGGAEPPLGADMSGQTQMVARYGAGMRITNEASDYGVNFHLTRHISSASRLYGTYFGYEPAGAVDESGIVARIYNAVAAGAAELFHYDNPPQGPRGERYKQYLELLRLREPVVEVGMLWPRASVDLGIAGELMHLGRAVRDVVDVDYIDERMIEDGALEGIKVFVWGTGPVIEQETADMVEGAVRDGLVLVVPRGFRPETPEGESLFPAGLTSDRPGIGSISVASLPDHRDALPGREGVFYGAEPDSLWRTNRTVCWTGGPVTLRFELPDQPCRVRIPYRVGPIQGTAVMRVDGTIVAEAAPNATGELEFDRHGAGGETVVVSIDADTWSPAAAGESEDTRELSVMLRDIVIAPINGAVDEEPAPVIHTVGDGFVVECADTMPELVLAGLAHALRESVGQAVLPEALIAMDAPLVYATVTTTDLLLYNHSDEDAVFETHAGDVTVPAHSIVSAPRWTE